jgi:dipicolinate synthase subunit A
LCLNFNITVVSAINCNNSEGADFFRCCSVIVMKKITVIGGDSRLITVKNHLIKQGYRVDSLGLSDDDNGDFRSSDIIILPVPTTRDNVNVYAPLTQRTIPLSFLKANINNSQIILCCNYSFETKRCIDYNSLDSYALLNAVPTAEGAISMAIENTPFTLWKSRVLVIGYGRVGKVLADRLKALGCKVVVSARKPADFAMLKALGFETVNTNNLNNSPLYYDIIFNTVDAKVIDDQSFETTTCRLIIDLSTKGGFSLPAAKEKGITAIKAPGLPGITAPETAGRILAETITEIINSFN